MAPPTRPARYKPHDDDGIPPDGAAMPVRLPCRMKARKSSGGSGSRMAPPTREQITALAHEIWLERGSPEGSDMDIWLEAERQLQGRATPHRVQDDIPADPDNPDADHDPAVNPPLEREIANIAEKRADRSPTSL
jgi:hypothetical protein